MQYIRKLLFVLWVRLSIEFWSMNVANCYLERRFCLSQDCNRAIRRPFSVVKEFLFYYSSFPLYNKDLLVWTSLWYVSHCKFWWKFASTFVSKKLFTWGSFCGNKLPKKKQVLNKFEFPQKKRKALLFTCLQNMFFFLKSPQRVLGNAFIFFSSIWLNAFKEILSKFLHFSWWILFKPTSLWNKRRHGK